VKAGVFGGLWERCLLIYDEQVGIQWTWQSMDGAMTKAPLGGEATGPNPTDREKNGTKWSLLNDRTGIPLAVLVAPANRKDCKLEEPTLEARQVLPPTVSQHLCMDKAPELDTVRTVTEAYCFTHHIRSRGEEACEMERNRKRRPHRWVVERARAWMNQFHRLLVRWERKGAN
jgi:putative transposase